MIQIPPQSHPLSDVGSRIFRKEWWLLLRAIANSVNNPLIRYGTSADRSLLNPSATPDAALFFELDTELVYQNQLVDNIPTWVLIDIVRGSANLTTEGAITMVSATDGEITESVVIQNSTAVYMLGRNFGVGALAPLQSTAGRRYIAVKGDTGGTPGCGGIALSQGDADADNTPVGIIQFEDSNSGDADKRIASIVGVTDGATANDRGGAVNISTKPDAGSVPVLRVRINRDGNSGFGGNAAPAYPVDATGIINAGTFFYVAGVQVVGPRGAALTASGASVIAAPVAYSQAYADSQTNLANNLKTRVDELEARLVAHGLIA